MSGGNAGTVGDTDLAGLGGEQVIWGGHGGAGPWGGGADPVFAGGGTYAAGHAGTGPGAGGSGGISNMIIGLATGGPGAAGAVIVTEYCFSEGGEDWAQAPWLNVNARVAVTEGQPWGPPPCR
jgi:hypothetical protein